ncbi:MAG: hypothetical protein ACHP7E_00175 [Burkholderiales bacterium]
MCIPQVLHGFASALAAAACWALLQGCAIAGGMHLLGTIELPGTLGRIDHLAYAPDRQLLFIAGLGANTLEVVDVAAGRTRSLAVLRRYELPGRPEAFSLARDRLYVNVPEVGAVVAALLVFAID